jgi:hypothetical protein
MRPDCSSLSLPVDRSSLPPLHAGVRRQALIPATKRLLRGTVSCDDGAGRDKSGPLSIGLRIGHAYWFESIPNPDMSPMFHVGQAHHAAHCSTGFKKHLSVYVRAGSAESHSSERSSSNCPSGSRIIAESAVMVSPSTVPPKSATCFKTYSRSDTENDRCVSPT